MITIEGVSKIYSATKVIDEVTLEIQKGRTTSLIGPSGCGKSTLLRLIIGLIDPDGGKISINNRDINADSAQELRQNIGYVIQQGGLFPHLSAKQNCSLVTNYLGWDSNKIDDRLTELCELTGIVLSDLSKYPSEFSGGQNQRI